MTPRPSQQDRRAAARGFAIAAGAGCAGAATAWAVGFPAPFLTGPILFSAIAALAGAPMRAPERLREASFLMIGVGMGAGVTPEALSAAARWPVSLALLAASLVAIVALCAPLLRRFFGFGAVDAALAASPGHMSYVLGMTLDLRLDVRRVTLVQTIRVMALSLGVPLLAIGFDGEAAPLGAFGPPLGLAPLAALLAAGLAVGQWLRARRIPAALLLGGMAVSAGAHGAGLTAGAVPDWALAPAFIAMGTLLGMRFGEAGPRSLAGDLGAGAALTVATCAVSAGAALAAAALIDAPAATLLIAFAPGGLEAMAAMALLTGADPAFVAAHHAFRLLFLTALMPAVVRALGNREGPGDPRRGRR